MGLQQAILPVAGLGTRFLPWTKAVPKELLPVGNQPMIALIVDECLSCGITDICFVISHGKEAIPQYFYENPALEEQLRRRGKTDLLAELRRYDAVNFHVVYQGEQLGDGHAVLQAMQWVRSEPVAILFGDDLILGKENGLQQLTRIYETLQSGSALLCLENVERNEVQKYGVIAIEEEQGRLKKVRSLVEKPHPPDAPSTLAIVGKYIIPRSVLDVLPLIRRGPGGEIRLIDALMATMPSTPMYGYEVEGKRIDTGTPEGYRAAIALLR